MCSIRSKRPLLLAVVVCAFVARAEHSFGQDGVAIRHVSVIPMDRDNVLVDRTVVVEGGRITQVASDSNAAIPDNARVVDGTGRYLIPGLVDMHVHVNWEDSLPQFLVHGVTTVRNMSGYSSHRRWQREIEAGERIGPTIFSACRTIDGSPRHPLFPNQEETVTVQQAEAAVERAHAEGWQFIKVYNSLSREVYHTILDRARVPVVGHVSVPGWPGSGLGGSSTLDRTSAGIRAMASTGRTGPGHDDPGTRADVADSRRPENAGGRTADRRIGCVELPDDGSLRSASPAGGLRQRPAERVVSLRVGSTD